MKCCSVAGYDDVFSPDAARRDLDRYRRRGLPRSAAWLCRALTEEGLTQSTVLEIGGGIGALQVELISAGAASTTNVELVESYEAPAGELIAQRGLDAKMKRRIGDLVVTPDLAPRATIVVMHRVVCCYPDAPGLLNTAANHAQRTLAITFPRDRWWIRLGFAGMNAWMRLRGSAFRGYVHPRALLLQAAQQAGFDETRSHEGRLWASLILQRRDTGRDGSRADA